MEKRRATIIFDDEDTQKKKSNYKNSERKTLKIDPPVHDLIKKMSAVTDVNIYELVENMANEYFNSCLSDEQKKLLKI